MSAKTIVQRLLDEMHEGGPSKEWLSAIEQQCMRVTRNGYPAQIYARSIEFSTIREDQRNRWEVADSTAIWGSSWAPESITTLANDVFILLSLERTPIGATFDSIVENVKAVMEKNHADGMHREPSSYLRFLLERAVRATLRLRVEKLTGSRFYARIAGVLEAPPFVKQGYLPDDELRLGGSAFGLEGVTTLLTLGLREINQAISVIRAFRLEESAVGDAERQNQRRGFTDRTLSTMIVEICTVTTRAVTIALVHESLKAAHPQLFPLSVTAKGSSSDVGLLSKAHPSTPVSIEEAFYEQERLRLEILSDQCASTIIGALREMDERMTYALSRQIQGASLKRIGEEMPKQVSGQYVGQLIAKAHALVRETFDSFVVFSDAREGELEQFRHLVMESFLRSLRNEEDDELR